MDIFLTINFARFHPLLVHLPIGILFFAFFLEIWKRWKNRPELDHAIGLALLAGCVFSVASAGTGWLLAGEGGYEEAGLFWHKWLGVATAIFSVTLYFLQHKKHGIFEKIYFPVFISTIGLLTATGHFGGNITHGENFLFSEPENRAIAVADIETANTFEVVIFPILKNKCNGCHNPGKAKGELVMTTAEQILKGGKSGPIFNFDSPAESEILRRIHLPEAEKKHMPPKGKRQLESDEIELLQWWVANGACFDCKVQDMAGNESVQHLLEKYVVAETSLAGLDVEPLEPADIAALNAAGIRAYPLADGSPFLVVNLANRRGLDNSVFKKLTAVGENIVELNLANSNFTDGDAHIIKKMPHLRKVQLQGTAVTEQCVENMTGLKYLESLNIYGTKIGDGALNDFKKMAALKFLYCWESGLTAAGVGQLQNANPRLEIQHQIDAEIFGEAELRAPEIASEGDFFIDSMAVSLTSNFRNTQLFYTLDGSVPDSTSSQYSAPFSLRETALLRAIARKDGWANSPVAERNFIQSKTAVAAVKLARQPNEKYRAEGGASLVDRQRGSTNFGEGKWLGYQGQHLVATLELTEKQPFSRVFVSALAVPSSWIFFPNGCKIWTSEDGVGFKLAKEITLPETTADISQAQKIFEIALGTTTAKFVKVEVQSPLKLPKWHPAAGSDCWIFVDEIIVD